MTTLSAAARSQRYSSRQRARVSMRMDLQHGKLAELAVPSFDCMQIRVADSQSRTPGWVSVNAFAHLQLREGARTRAPVVFSLVGTLGAARE